MKAIKSLIAAAGLAVLAGCGAENKAVNLLQTMEVQKGECVSFPTEGCKGIEFCYLGSDYDDPFSNKPGEPNAEFYFKWTAWNGSAVIGAVDRRGPTSGFVGCNADVLSFDKDKIRIYWY